MKKLKLNDLKAILGGSGKQHWLPIVAIDHEIVSPKDPAVVSVKK